MTGLDSYCLTGDNNLINVMCVIQYNIFEPVKYKFHVSNPESMLKNMACNTIIHSMACMQIRSDTDRREFRKRDDIY